MRNADSLKIKLYFLLHYCNRKRNNIHMMASNSGIPQVFTAGKRPVTSNQRDLASSVTAPANVSASLKDEERYLTGKANRFEMQIAAQDQRIAALELPLLASTRSSASTT